jgi:DNA-binding response OmpR family regulator
MRPRVLVVDDDPDVLRLLQITLERDGFKPALAGDGGTALRRIEAERFDVVLLDVMMPVMDGWQVLQAIHGMPNPPRVIVVSAKAHPADRARAYGLGAAEYVTKPFPLDALVGVIESVLGRGHEKHQRLINGDDLALHHEHPPAAG